MESRQLSRSAALAFGFALLLPAIGNAGCYGCKYSGGRAYVIATCVSAAPNETGSSICTAKVIPGTSAMTCEFGGNFCTEMTVGGGGGAGGGAGSGGGNTCAGGPAGCPAECFACGGNGGGVPAF